MITNYLAQIYAPNPVNYSFFNPTGLPTELWNHILSVRLPPKAWGNLRASCKPLNQMLESPKNLAERIKHLLSNPKLLAVTGIRKFSLESKSLIVGLKEYNQVATVCINNSFENKLSSGSFRYLGQNEYLVGAANGICLSQSPTSLFIITEDEMSGITYIDSGPCFGSKGVEVVTVEGQLRKHSSFDNATGSFVRLDKSYNPSSWDRHFFTFIYRDKENKIESRQLESQLLVEPTLLLAHGERFFAAYDKKIHIYNADKTDFQTLDIDFEAMVIGADSNHLVVVSTEGNFFCYSLETLKEISSFHEDDIPNKFIVANGTCFMAMSEEIIIHDIKYGVRTILNRAEENPVGNWSLCGELLGIVPLHDTKAELWHWPTSTLLKTYFFDDVAHEIQIKWDSKKNQYMMGISHGGSLSIY